MNKDTDSEWSCCPNSDTTLTHPSPSSLISVSRHSGSARQTLILRERGGGQDLLTEVERCLENECIPPSHSHTPLLPYSHTPLLTCSLPARYPTPTSPPCPGDQL